MENVFISIEDFLKNKNVEYDDYLIRKLKTYLYNDNMYRKQKNKIGEYFIRLLTDNKNVNKKFKKIIEDHQQLTKKYNL